MSILRRRYNRRAHQASATFPASVDLGYSLTIF
jgi:hypothetical protein